MPDQNGRPTLADILKQADSWSGDLEARKQARDMVELQGKQSSDLAKLNGEIDDRNEANKLNRKVATLEDLILKNRKSAVGVEGLSVNPEPNPMLNPFINDRAEARLDRQVREIADRTEKSGITRVAPALKGAESKFQGKSTTPMLNMLPHPIQGIAANAKSRLGELFNKPDWQGAGEEFQELSRLINQDIRSFAGSAQTQAEAAKQMMEKGMQPGGSPEQVQRGMQMMREAVTQQAKNIEAGSNPTALQRYAEQNSGQTPSGILGKRPVKKLRNKSGQVKVIYDDGSEEIQ